MKLANLSELARAAFVIARRDYSATVLSKTFLFFLIGPLFPLLLGGMFGGLGNQIARGDEQAPRVAVIADASEFAELQAAQQRVVPVIPRLAQVELIPATPADDPEAQKQQLLDGASGDIIGVLEQPFGDRPHFTGGVGGQDGTVKQLALFIELAQQARGAEPPKTQLYLTQQARVATSLESSRKLISRSGQMLLFILTLLLSTMLLSQMLEEKGNKVIEVLAAAVPVDAIFVGKLFAMLAISLTGIAVWLAVALGLTALVWDPAQSSPALFAGPAVGWGTYLVLLPIYFSMSYLLIGAAFLGIGAQASTVREVQTLSMPVTMFQVVLLMIAFSGVGRPDSWQAIAAAVFPLSSPFAMIGRAAEQDMLWIHGAALLWQAIWVALILHFAAKLFRRSVLKSGKPFRWPWQRAAA